MRSVLSLASGRGSSGSGRSNRADHSKPYGKTSGSGAPTQPAKEITDSEIELTNLNVSASGSRGRSNDDYRSEWERQQNGGRDPANAV